MEQNRFIEKKKPQKKKNTHSNKNSNVFNYKIQHISVVIAQTNRFTC